MRKCIKTCISALLASVTAICNTSAFASPIGAFEGTFPQFSHSDNKFGIEGCDDTFIYMETEADGVWIVCADGQYGRKEFDINGIQSFNTTDENNVGYWLNHDFLTSGNDGKTLPDAIVNNLCTDYLWDNQQTSAGGAALLSVDEIKDHRIGVKDGTNPEERPGDEYYYWLTRTPDKQNSGNVVSVGVNRLMNSVPANKAYGIRPVFALKDTFYKSVKLTDMGFNVRRELAEMCSDAELLSIGYDDAQAEAIRAAEDKLIRTVSTDWENKTYVIDTTPKISVKVKNSGERGAVLSYAYRVDDGEKSDYRTIYVSKGKTASIDIAVETISDGAHTVKVYEKCGTREKLLGEYDINYINSNPNNKKTLKGYVAHFNSGLSLNNSRIELMNAAGSTLARCSVYWRWVEAEKKGEYCWKPGDYTSYVSGRAAPDQYIPALIDAGLDITLILHGTNSLYNDAEESVFSTKESVEAFGKFAGAVAARYPQITKFEIWNEPNAKHVWGDVPNAENYGAVLKAASDAIKAVNPDAEIFSAGMNNNQASETLADWKEFTSKAIQTAPMADGIGFHSYTHWSSPENRYYYDEVDKIALDNGGFYNIYLTETGYLTGNGSASVTEEKQAENNVKLFCWGDYYGMRSITLYEFLDGIYETPYDPVNNEHNFGAVRQDFTPKKSYYSVKTYLEEANGAEFIGRYSPAEGINAYVYLDKDGKPFVLMWNGANNAAVNYSVDADVRLYDLYGREKVNTGTIAFDAADKYGGEPVYLKNIPMNYVSDAAIYSASEVLDKLYGLTGNGEYSYIKTRIASAKSAAGIKYAMERLNSEAEKVISSDKTANEKGKLLTLIYRAEKYMTNILTVFNDEIARTSISGQVFGGAADEYVARRIFRCAENLVKENTVSDANALKNKISKGRILLAAYLYGWSEKLADQAAN